MDFSKIEVDGKLLGVLNFNLMIPIEEAQLETGLKSSGTKSCVRKNSNGAIGTAK